jgi:hypothetical protein
MSLRMEALLAEPRPDPKGSYHRVANCLDHDTVMAADGTSQHGVMFPNAAVSAHRQPDCIARWSL